MLNYTQQKSSLGEELWVRGILLTGGVLPWSPFKTAPDCINNITIRPKANCSRAINYILLHYKMFL